MEVTNETNYYYRIYNKFSCFASITYAYVSTKFLFL